AKSFRKRGARRPLSFRHMIERTIGRSFPLPFAPTYYHYTTWEGARGILETQRFWATAHDCTNDQAELESADEVIIEVARERRTNARNIAAVVLDRLISGYTNTRIAATIPTYLSCFSL